MIDLKTLELIKNDQYSEGTTFSEEEHKIIHSFYEGFDLDKQDSEYRYQYVTQFIQEHEAFIINYITNIYNANLKATDKLSDEMTFNKFLDTLALYLTKYYDEDGQTVDDFRKENRKCENHDDYKYY